MPWMCSEPVYLPRVTTAMGERGSLSSPSAGSGATIGPIILLFECTSAEVKVMWFLSCKTDCIRGSSSDWKLFGEEGPDEENNHSFIRKEEKTILLEF